MIIKIKTSPQNFETANYLLSLAISSLEENPDQLKPARVCE